MSDIRDNVIHVRFGAEGGKRLPAAPRVPAAEPPPAPAAPTPSSAETSQAADTSSSIASASADATVAEAHRRDPVGDLYACAEVARLFDVPESRLRYWDKTGFLSPSGALGERRFYTFQDLIGLRAAKGLLERGVPLRRVRRSVEALKATLPTVVRPLSELRVVADGKRCVVQGREGRWEPATGQLVLDFDVRALRDEVVRVLRPGSVDPARRRSAYEAYLEGCRLDEDPTTFDRAEGAYRRAIALDPTFAHALTNLGNLRFRRADAREAEVLYRRALELDPEQPEAFYNLGFLAFERGDANHAVTLFERAIATDPGFADAHFNLAMALEATGRAPAARVHWESYLALDPRGPWAEIAKQHL